MTTTDRDLSALLAALDAGDDSVIGPLSDLLEELGDPRAVELRLVGDRSPERFVLPGAIWYAWRALAPHSYGVSADEAEALALVATSVRRDGRLLWKRRSVAIFALAGVRSALVPV